MLGSVFLTLPIQVMDLERIGGCFLYTYLTQNKQNIPTSYVLLHRSKLQVYF